MRNPLDTKVFVVHHKPYSTHENGMFIPIQAGTSIAETKLSMLGDDTGDNISHKNRTHCELTAMYWVWKNITADFIGFCHYCRYFVPEDTSYRCGTPMETSLEELCDPTPLLAGLEQCDVLVPEPMRLGQSVASQYRACHVADDFDTALDVLAIVAPEYVRHLGPALYENSLLFWFNMFVMKSDLFDEYMTWLFSILDEVEKRIVLSDDPYQRRVFGFLAERLETLFIYCKVKSGVPMRVLPWIATSDGETGSSRLVCERGKCE